MPDSPLMTIFDRATADMIRFAGQHRDRPEGQVADAMSRQFRVFTQTLAQGGPEALNAMLDSPEELRRRNIDPAFASGIKQFTARHAGASAVSAGMTDELSGLIRQEATVHAQRLQGAGTGPRPGAAPPSASPPPASPPPSPPSGSGRSGGGESRGAGPVPGTSSGFASGAAAAGGGGNGAGNGGGANNPPHQNPQAGDAGGDRRPQQMRPTSKAGLAVKAIFGVLAAVGIGYGVSQYKLGSDKQDKTDASPIKTRTYPTAESLEKSQGTERIFVEQAMGITGLSGMAMKDRGKALQDKTGLTPQQFAKLNVALGKEDVKTGLTRQMKSPEQKASLIMAQKADGSFVAIDDKAAQGEYAGSLKVKIDLSKQEVSLTAEDPRNGKGPQTAIFANAPMVQNHLILDPQERAAAMGSTIVAAEASVAAAKAAAAASAASAAAKNTAKPE